MGGRGSGGARIGAGRKPKDIAVKVLQGTATVAVRKARGGKKAGARDLPAASAVEIPGGLSATERKVWRALSPHALASRTLTPATALAFRDLCEAVVMKDEIRSELRGHGGYTTEGKEGLKAHPLIAQYRTILQRVEAGLTRFMLAPLGKPTAGDDDKPVDPWAEFDDEGGDDAGNGHTH